MATPQLKIQLEFRMGREGWSEIYYVSGSGPKASAGIAQALVTARVKVLVNKALIHHVRITELTPSIPSYRFVPIGNVGALTAARDVGLITTNVVVYSAAGHKRTLQLHGLPDNDHSYDANGVENTTLSGAVSTFLIYLKGAFFNIKSVHRGAGDPLNVAVINIVVNAGVLTVYTDTTGLSVKQKVRISGAKGYKARQWNGVYKIASLVAAAPPLGTAFTAQTIRLIDPSGTYVQSSGVLRDAMLTGFDFLPIADNDQFTTDGSRRTGRPTDAPRGRASLKR